MTTGKSSNYMGSGLAQTYDHKKAQQNGTSGLLANNSAGSIGMSAYTVPSQDGRQLPAIPIKLALKYAPPTIAVVYQMKDSKSGRMKKYIHEIKIKFEPNESVEKKVDYMIKIETTYLNPAFIAKSQVSVFKFKIQYALQIMYLMQKLYDQNVKEQEDKAPGAQVEQQQELPQRKPNFFERKRFVDYEQNNDSDHDKEKLKPTEDVQTEEVVEVFN